MKDTCKVTIGLCAKNAEATVADAINSILNQDYPLEFMELIVVDGCSTDKTLPLIEKCLSTVDIRHTILSENNGLGFARQLVVDNAKGDYVVWVDSDLILPRNYIAKQVAFMKQHPDAGIGRAKYGLLPHERIVAFLENIPFIVECLKHQGNVPLGICGTEGAIFRVASMRQVGGFDVDIVGAGEDTDIADRIRKAGWKTCLTDATFYERCRDTWVALWNEYFWWGYGGHYSFHKQRDSLFLLKTSPMAGFLAGILRVATAYRLTHRNSVLLLPFHYMFKRVAYLFGFIKADIDGYGHS